MKVLISTVPFGQVNNLSIELLSISGVNYLINPLNKKFTEDELINYVEDVDVIIAGTEPITEKVMNNGKNLKMIS